jgi:hypothetical protein
VDRVGDAIGGRVARAVVAAGAVAFGVVSEGEAGGAVALHAATSKATAIGIAGRDQINARIVTVLLAVLRLVQDK